MFETVYYIVLGNQNNINQCIRSVPVLNRSKFVPNCTRLLVTTFKDKNFILNKIKVLSELLYRHIFEITKFEPVILSYVEILKFELSKNSLYILRKVCMIDGNLMNLVQKRLLHILYKEDYVLRYSIKTKSDGMYIYDKK